MIEEKIYELRRDATTPNGYWRAGIKKTESEWRKEFGNENMTMWNSWFIDLSVRASITPKDELQTLANSVFDRYGLASITYKEAAMEVAELWLKQNKKDGNEL